MSLSKESIRKLRAVKAAILAEPELYDQRVFADKYDPCGSPCCIAGWLVWLEDPSKYLKLSKEHGDFIGEAECILRTETGVLFGTGACWPEPFAQQLCDARTPKDKAIAAAGAIESFIKSGGIK